ncbi:MAG: nucleotide pyrophosphohydrolase [Comamonadaceae bacterium]|nr:MAG: nucleotide pyrophosphohydrolase [Comamonadaceae bacterium]
MASEEVLQEVREFVAERDWSQFHTPASLARSIVIESAELLEHFQWNEDFDRAEVLDELADVATYALLLADALDADLDEIVQSKLAKTRAKYPVEKARGRSAKYDRLPD